MASRRRSPPSSGGRSCVSGILLTDVPLVVIAVAAFVLTLFVSVGFALVLVAAGVAYELWRNAARWARRANSLALGPLALVAIGAITVSLTAELFLEGLKAGLLTFGGAYTVIPFLQESSVNVHHYLTDSRSSSTGSRSAGRCPRR